MAAETATRHRLGAEGAAVLRKKFSRRNVIGMSAAALATTGAVAIAKRDIESLDKGIETPNGIFFGIYEAHIRGIEPQDIPDKTDVIFEELATDSSLYNQEPQRLLDTRIRLPSENTAPLLKDSVLEKLIKNQVTIAFGDTAITEDTLKKIGLVENIRLEGGIASELGAFASYLYSKLGGKLDDSDKQPNLLLKISRRKLVRNLLGGFGLLLIAPVLTDVPFINKFFQERIDVKQKDALSRILSRLEGLAAHSRPENHKMFFRNLLMANKLSMIAETTQQQLGRKARIAFNVGGAHTGIEDFLRLGHDFCRGLISMYPESFLREMAEINGSLENLCTVRTISIPSEISVDDIRKDNLDSKSARIVDNKIIDIPLYQSLKLRLAQ